jgi:hypothetical protein
VGRAGQTYETLATCGSFELARRRVRMSPPKENKREHTTTAANTCAQHMIILSARISTIARNNRAPERSTEAYVPAAYS